MTHDEMERVRELDSDSLLQACAAESVSVCMFMHGTIGESASSSARSHWMPCEASGGGRSGRLVSMRAQCKNRQP